MTVKGTLDGKAYALAQVSDPGGPFAGFFYAGGTPLKIDRVALYNPNESAASKHKYPDGTKKVTWYDYNAAHHGDELAAYLAAVHDHEGWGQGQPDESILDRPHRGHGRGHRGEPAGE